jgi:Fibrobacter succinogenes major domain (Fib_succ_major).
MLLVANLANKKCKTLNAVMKKFALLFALMATVFASCSENGLQVENPTSKAPIKLNIIVSNPNGDDTKAAIKSDWDTDDVIKIWYDSNTQTNPDLVIKYDGTSWANDGTATVSGNTPSASGTVKAVYSDNVAVAAKDSYTYSNNTLSFHLATWTFLTELQVVVTGIPEQATNYTLACDRFSPYNGFTVGAESITANAGTNGNSVNGIANTDGVAFVFASSDLWGSEGDYNFTLNATTAGSGTYKATTTINKPASQIKGLKIKYNKFFPVPPMTDVFTVDANGTQVRFAPGNLQATYHTATSSYSWGFAANQYDYVGVGDASGNTTINGQTDGAIVDLFCWSTNATNNNWGIHTITGNNYTYIGGDFNDWGTLMGNNWRTLSQSEWDYLRNTERNISNNINLSYSYRNGVTVCGIKCFVLAPDGNTEPIAATYNSSEWTAAESKGFVCLPAAGYRNGDTVNAVNDKIYYWSSTPNATNTAYYLLTKSDYTIGVLSDIRNHGASVRLVTDVPSAN